MSPGPDPIALIQPVVPALRRYARALLRDRDDADDLVQDVLERAISRIHQRRADASIRAWLFAIVHNLAMDRLRQRNRRGPADPIESVPEAHLSAPAQQEAAIARKDILSLIASLPAEQSSVLLLVGVEELSYADAALVLDIPVGTVMSRLSRGRDRLRRLMNDGSNARTSFRIVS